MNSLPLIDRIVCLSELSKNIEGELRPVEAEREKCPDLECVTLETVHLLDLTLATASGAYTPKAVALGQDDFLPWKRGVSL